MTDKARKSLKSLFFVSLDHFFFFSYVSSLFLSFSLVVVLSVYPSVVVPFLRVSFCRPDLFHVISTRDRDAIRTEEVTSRRERGFLKKERPRRSFE